jgi:hypothetical protein
VRRREFVATGLASSTSLAGCSAPGPESNRRATSSPVPLSEYGCPPYAPGADAVVCSHTVAREAAG